MWQSLSSITAARRVESSQGSRACETRIEFSELYRRLNGTRNIYAQLSMCVHVCARVRSVSERVAALGNSPRDPEMVANKRVKDIH